uniref:sialoadhesin-like n=1 Tax=Pristiophorus japonicus TaxID=55135 RepID=UPI00398ED3AC
MSTSGHPEIRNVTQPRRVSVLRGKSATLNCTFNYIANESDWVHIKWYISSPGIADVHYGTSKHTCIPDIAPGGFKHCATSLKIENVSFTISDYNYTCVVVIPVYPPVESRGPGTRLHVDVPPSPPAISITQEKLVAMNESSLHCLARGFYPQNISIKWLHQDQTISHNAQSSKANDNTKYTIMLPPSRNSDGTFSITSQMTFIPISQDHGTICTCQVLHTTSNERIIKHITLNVNYGPQPIIHYRTSDSDKLCPLLQCTINVMPQSFLELNCTADSNPAPSVTWEKKSRGQRIQLYSGKSNLGYTKASIDDSDSGEYICRAFNDYGLKEHAVVIYITSGWKSSFLLRSVSVPIFVVSVILLLIWSSKWKDRYGPCNCRHSKRHENQGSSVKSDRVEDADAHEDKITEF